jgi:hypothetical protein
MHDAYQKAGVRGLTHVLERALILHHHPEIVHFAGPYPLAFFEITRAFCRSSIAAPGHNDTAVSNAARATIKLSAVAMIRSPLGATSITLNSSFMSRREQIANAESIADMCYKRRVSAAAFQ